MIYGIATQVLIPGKMAEYSEIVAKEQAPLYPKIGVKLVASWHNYTGNMNMVHGLFVYDDLTAYKQAMEKMRGNTDFMKTMAKMNTLLVSTTYTLLEPNSWSPMK